MPELVAWMTEVCGRNVLDLARAPRLELKDLFAARKAIRLLDEKHILPVVKIENLLKAHAESLLQLIDFASIIGPERRRLVARLHDKVSNASSLANAEMKKLAQTLEEKVAQLKPEMESLQSGARKNVMTTNWLNLIRSRIMEELRRQGFKENTTAEDYINEPPPDLKGTQQNLAILSRCLEEIVSCLCGCCFCFFKKKKFSKQNSKRSSLSPKLSSPSIVQVIEELKAEIYPVIRKYIWDCFALFSDLFRVEPCDAARAQALLQSRQAQLSEQERKFVAQLLDDVGYLSQMELIEETQTKKQTHIVSISGLAIGRLVRLEQEMRTVCEVRRENGKRRKFYVLHKKKKKKKIGLGS